MGKPLHSRVRRQLKYFLNRLVVNLSSQRYKDEPIEPESIKRILLIRINYRIGNIVFMTPLIRALEQKLPNAKVDMLVGASFTAPMMQEMPNIQNVYTLPRKMLKSPIKLLKYIKELNQNNYDLIISPKSDSASSNIATLLLKSPIKLGFYNAESWTAANRYVLHNDSVVHEALQPLELMNIFSGDKIQYNRYLDIALSTDEKEEGEKILFDLFKKNNIIPKNKRIIGIFRDARYEKKIDPNWWIEFATEMQKIDENIIFIDILNPDEKEPLMKDMLSISSPNLRELAKIFSALDIFVCGDTGPMHLACASLTPVIAFFNVTNPTIYGPLGKDDKTILIDNKSIKTVSKEVFEHIVKINNKI